MKKQSIEKANEELLCAFINWWHADNERLKTKRIFDDALCEAIYNEQEKDTSDNPFKAEIIKGKALERVKEQYAERRSAAASLSNKRGKVNKLMRHYLRTYGGTND